MSFRDLEQSINKALAEYRAGVEAKAAAVVERARRKSEKLKRASRPPLYRPDAPQKYIIKVVINARMKVGDQLGELVELEYLIPTLSQVEAELEAIKLARDCGYVWRGTVSVDQL